MDKIYFHYKLYIMIKDSDYYRKRADLFYQKASQADNDYDNYSDDEYEYEYVPIPIASPTPTKPNLVNNHLNVAIKQGCKRYYDPIKRHYYRIDDLIEKSEPPVNTSEVWYPETKLSYDTVYNPSTGSYSRIKKVYDADGNYSYEYTDLPQHMIKRSGTNYYVLRHDNR